MKWTRILPHAPEEPQELDLLGPLKLCVGFSSCIGRRNKHWTFSETGRSMAGYVYRNKATSNDKNRNTPINWCNYTSPILFWSSSHPKVLHQGMFFICRDIVWAGIPSQLQGCPRSLGQLTTLTPNTTLINYWRQKNELAHQKRSYEQFDENCNS